MMRTPHPGEVLVDYLAAHTITQSELAWRTSMKKRDVKELCKGHAPVTTSVAAELERVLQRPAHFWLNLQRQYDEAETRRSKRSKAKGNKR